MPVWKRDKFALVYLQLTLWSFRLVFIGTQATVYHCWRRVKSHFSCFVRCRNLHYGKNLVLCKLVCRGVNLETLLTNNLENMLYLFVCCYFYRSLVPEWWNKEQWEGTNNVFLMMLSSIPLPPFCAELVVMSPVSKFGVRQNVLSPFDLGLVYCLTFPHGISW